VGEQYQNLLDDATAGLKDDPELRLDVRAELASHLDAAAALYAADGHDAAASADLAAKDFGSPVEVAGELLAANKGRMKWRALARLFLRAVVVPAAVIIAVVIGYGWLARVVNLVRQVNTVTYSLPALSKISALPAIPRYRNPRERQALARFTALTPNPFENEHPSDEQRRRQWLAHRQSPDGPKYYAYYAGQLRIPKAPDWWRQGNWGVPNTIPPWKQQPSPDAPDDVPPPPPHDDALAQQQRIITDFRHFEGELRTGEKLDPDNAIYHYRLALAYLMHSMVASAEMAVVEPQPDELYYLPDFNRGVAELERAFAKPYLATYHGEMVRDRLALLPPAYASEDYLLRYQASMWELFPELAQTRSIARKYSGCVRLLVRQGRRQEAEQLLQGWDRLPVQMTRSANTAIELLVANALMAIQGETAAEGYDSIGKPEEARKVRTATQRFTTLVQQLKTQRQTAPLYIDTRYRMILADYAAGLSAFTPPLELTAPIRHYEQTMFEQLTLGVMLVLLTVVVLVCGALTLYWHFRLRGAPLLLLPGWRESARILGYGVLLPVLLYALYIQLPISGRDFGVLYLWKRMLVELTILVMTCTALPALLAGQWARARCRRLGVEVPQGPFRIPLHVMLWLVVCGGISTAVWAIVRLLGSPVVYHWPEPWTTAVFSLGTVLGILSIGWLLIRLYRGTTHGRGAAPYAVYRGTVVHSLVPVYAAAVIMLALLAGPYLSHRERSLLRQDRVVFPRKETFGVSPFEYQQIQALKAAMLRAVNHR
jgi:hypothetical protein